MATKIKLIADNVITTSQIDTSSLDSHFTGGTGVTYSSGTISIGQAVHSTDSPTFADLTITGNLNITGDINSYNVTDLDVTDQTITLGAGQIEANSGGSGIIVDGSGASILWDETNDTFDINKGLNVDSDTFVVDNTNNKVGIGTASPGAGLHINRGTSGLPSTSGTTQDGTLRLSSLATSGIIDIGMHGSTPWIQATDSGDLSYGYSLLLNPNGGNVGIGVSGAPATILHVSKNTSSGSWGVYPTIQIDNPNAAGYASLAFTQGSTASDIRFRIEDDHTNNRLVIDQGGGGTEGITLQGSNSYVGINNPSPDFRLDISSSSDTQLRLNTTDGNSGLFYSTAGTNQWELYSRNADNSFRLYNYTTTATPLTVLGASNNVGIHVTTPQKSFEAWNLSNNDFVSVGSRQVSIGVFTGVHFGYAESGNNLYRKSAIVFERTDASENNAQGKVHILNGPQSGASNATLSDRKITIMENGNVEVPFLRAMAWSGGTMPTNGTDAIELGVSGGYGFVHGYDRTNAHYIPLYYDGTEHRWANSGSYTKMNIDPTGNVAISNGASSTLAATTQNSNVGGVAHTGVVFSTLGPIVSGRAKGNTGTGYSASDEPRCVRDWCVYTGPSSNAGAYVHFLTNLDGGGTGAGNFDYTMSFFRFRAYCYGGGGNVAEGTLGWHNWAGNFYNVGRQNYNTNWELVRPSYVSAGNNGASVGKVVLVCYLPAAYAFIGIDWDQWSGYPFRNRKVTNIEQHSAATGYW